MLRRCHPVGLRLLQGSVVQHEAIQAPSARMDRVQKGPVFPLLLQMVALKGERDLTHVFFNTLVQALFLLKAVDYDTQKVTITNNKK